MIKKFISLICSFVLLFSSFEMVLTVRAASDGYKISFPEPVEVVDFNNINNLKSCINGGDISDKYTRPSNKYSIYWGDHEKNGSVAVYVDKTVPDWTEYECLSMWIYSEKATGEEIMIAPHSQKGTEGLRYYEEWITVDWTGWKFVSIRLSRLYIRRRTPVMSDMHYIAFRAEGWTVKGQADTKLYIADIKLEPVSVDASIRYAYGDDKVNAALKSLKKDTFAVYAGSSNVVTDSGTVYDMGSGALWQNKKLWLPESFFADFLGKSVSDADYVTAEADGVKYYAAAVTAEKLGFFAYTDGRFVMIGKEEDLAHFRRDSDDTVNIPSEIVKYFASHKPYNKNTDTEAELKKLRDNWRKTLLGNEETNDMSNDKVAAMINRISADGKSTWDKLMKEPEGNELFKGTAVTNISKVSSAYSLILKMAKAWGTFGSGYYMNEELREDILYAIRWMNDNAFGMHCLARKDSLAYASGGWFDWEIGVPMCYSKILMIMENELSREELNEYLEFLDLSVGYPDDAGANTVRFAYSIIASAALKNDADEILRTNARVEEELLYKDDVLNWRDADVGQGFHSDGSYVFHYNYAMNGLYGLEHMEAASEYLQILNGTSFMPSRQGVDYMTDFIFKSFDPLIYRGAMYRMTMARKYKHDQYALGARISACMLRIMEWADEEDTAAMKSLIKEYELTRSGTLDYYSYITPYEGLKLYNILENPEVVSRDGAVINKMYHNMDQMVHSRKEYGIGLAMHSSRIMSYEAYENENMNSWYMSDGRYQVVVPGTEGNQTNNCWQYINYYKLPGTTVDTQVRQAVAFGDGDGYRSSKDFVGGVSDGEYGAATMHLESFHNAGEKSGQPLHTNDLEAKKSYFMFDDEIVCLGSDINAKNNNDAEVLTVVDNRMATGTKTIQVDGVTVNTGKDKVTVDGKVISFVGDSHDITGAKWVHLAKHGGYYFPEPEKIKGMQMQWSREKYSFFELWMSHGVNPTDEGYAYAILPGKTAEETKSYAENPSFIILANNKRIQAVKNTKLGITQIVFHEPGSIEGITADKPMLVMVRKKENSVEVTASDPTQKLTDATIKLDRSLLDVINKDVKLTLEEENTLITADFDNSKGRSMSVEFAKPATLGDIHISDSVSVAVEGKTDEGAMLILAEYAGNELVRVKIATADSGGVIPKIGFDNKPAVGSVIKAFLWDSSLKAIISEPKSAVFEQK